MRNKISTLSHTEKQVFHSIALPWQAYPKQLFLQALYQSAKKVSITNIFNKNMHFIVPTNGLKSVEFQEGETCYAKNPTQGRASRLHLQSRSNHAKQEQSLRL